MINGDYYHGRKCYFYSYIKNYVSSVSFTFTTNKGFFVTVMSFLGPYYGKRSTLIKHIAVTYLLEKKCLLQAHLVTIYSTKMTWKPNTVVDARHTETKPNVLHHRSSLNSDWGQVLSTAVTRFISLLMKSPIRIFKYNMLILKEDGGIKHNLVSRCSFIPQMLPLLKVSKHTLNIKRICNFSCENNVSIQTLKILLPVFFSVSQLFLERTTHPND